MIEEDYGYRRISMFRPLKPRMTVMCAFDDTGVVYLASIVLHLGLAAFVFEFSVRATFVVFHFYDPRRRHSETLPVVLDALAHICVSALVLGMAIRGVTTKNRHYLLECFWGTTVAISLVSLVVVVTALDDGLWALAGLNGVLFALYVAQAVWSALLLSRVSYVKSAEKSAVSDNILRISEVII